MNRQVILALVVSLGLAGAAFANGPKSLEERVRHELAMLPYYGPFDSLSFRVDGETVTLLGEVTRPTLKSDAAAVVRALEGVEGVDNQIDVLPLSPYDNRIRAAVYRSIYAQPSLSRYAIQARPAIHIIVRNGTVRLEGVVATEMDRTIAGLQASGVSGVFELDNNLRVENPHS
jgi:hyperosmotically inducible protein